jgi:hypothetical protein
VCVGPGGGVCGGGWLLGLPPYLKLSSISNGSRSKVVMSWGPVLSWHGPSYIGSHFKVKKEGTNRIVGPNMGPTF